MNIQCNFPHGPTQQNPNAMTGCPTPAYAPASYIPPSKAPFPVYLLQTQAFPAPAILNHLVPLAFSGWPTVLEWLPEKGTWGRSICSSTGLKIPSLGSHTGCRWQSTDFKVEKNLHSVSWRHSCAIFQHLLCCWNPRPLSFPRLCTWANLFCF